MQRAPDGGVIETMMDTTGWHLHTVPGAMARALKTNLGLEVTSEKIKGRAGSAVSPPPDPTPEALRRRPERAAASSYDGLVSVAVRPTDHTCASGHFPAALRFWTYRRCSSGECGHFRLWRWILQYQQAATMFSSVSRPPSERACRCSAVQRSALGIRFVRLFR
jgi:hypothetical protein